MSKRIRAAAIIFMGSKLVTIYREKMINGMLKKYYTIPGGGVEEGESIKEAVKREVLEEVGIQIEVTDKYLYYENEKSIEYFYESNYVSGMLGTGTGPEFTERNVEEYGLYKLILVDRGKIKDIDLLPSEVKEYILQKFY